MIEYQVVALDGNARAGTLRTRHGSVDTPAFMPVATQAAVKALSPAEVESSGVRMLISNTYHLWLRPGAEEVASLGGIHKLMRWPHVVATDSGGFQAYSLASRTKLSEEGFEFSSHIDGARKHLSPEESMRVQGLLGSDIALQLDVCPPADSPRPQVVSAVERTTRWAERCLAARTKGQALFGIAQGGTDVELRLQHIEELGRLPLDGLALGGFSVGEPPSEMHRALPQIVPAMAPSKPRYLMGVGTPRDLVVAVGSGIDMFDCVIPTRNGRNGQAFVPGGKLVIKNARHKLDGNPLQEDCTCPACRGGFSRAYLRHLYTAGEILAHRLLTLHNLHYFQRLMQDCRAAIVAGKFSGWSEAFLSSLEVRDPAPTP